MQILKFGGKSLANGTGITNVLAIIEQKLQQSEPIGMILSARGKTTDILENFLEQARLQEDITAAWKTFQQEQLLPYPSVDLSEEFTTLQNIFLGVQLLGDYSLKVKDKVLAHGEILSCKLIDAILKEKGYKTQFVDARELIVTDDNFGSANVNLAATEAKIKAYFKDFGDTTPIITGFIAANEQGETTTLGRNGSNYSASLLAHFLGANKLESYTHINGIYTANPDYVQGAKIISELNYNEANELASFGASILHPKTIQPLLEKKIPLHILNTFNTENKGTLISESSQKEGVKSITLQENRVLINLVGKGLLGKVGVDARIFSTLRNQDISVGIISQGSSERGISFVLDSADETIAIEVLRDEFKYELEKGDIQDIYADNEISVITVIGSKIDNFSNILNLFNKNNISPLLINNTISRKNVSLVVRKKDQKKIINLVHSQIFGVDTVVNLAIFGVGTVGSYLIQQILEAKEKIQINKGLQIRLFAITNSKQVLFPTEIQAGWKEELLTQKRTTDVVSAVLDYADKHNLINLVAIDNTASEAFTDHYPRFIQQGFDLISSNKIANTLPYDKYQNFRELVKKHNKTYLYETNVGAGLPIIDTIKLLHQSGEYITKIKGVFSGSLSFIFNTFSASDVSFSEVLQQAIDKGYTEPDPREDLNGNDVARKLLILARELGLHNEFDEIKIQNVIPEHLREVSLEHFMTQLDAFNAPYTEVKNQQEPEYVLRYVGELKGDLSQDKGGVLEVKLISVPKNSALGGLTGSDSLIEIYTESYGENPITIIGAGAGAAVTARGVFGDILRIADKK